VFGKVCILISKLEISSYLKIVYLKGLKYFMSKMPVIFVGHGSPMNAIEDNDYSRNWEKLQKVYQNQKQ
jgi:hypothetical protein